MSSSAFQPLGALSRTTAKSMAKELAQIAGCGFNSSKEILECFLKLDGYTVLNVQQKLKVGFIKYYFVALAHTSVINYVEFWKNMLESDIAELPLENSTCKTSQ